jgi:hypothetical protein
VWTGQGEAGKDDFLILTFFQIFKNNTSKTLFADLTLLAAPARVAAG